MTDSLESVLDGKVTTEEPEQQQEIEAEAPPVEASTDDSKEVTEPTGEEVASSPEEKTDPVKGLQAGIAAERHKRQQAEAQLRRMQQQQPKPDFWENPEQALAGFSQQMQAHVRKATTDMAENYMRKTHDDYDDMRDVFVRDAETNPALIVQMNQAQDPAEFAYNYGKTQTRMVEMNDPQYEEKLKAKHFAEFEAMKASEVEAEVKKRTELPGTLSNERAAGGNTKQKWSQPSAEELYG